MSTTADALHIQGGTGRVVIENGNYIGQGDDGLNIHDHYQDVEEVCTQTAGGLRAGG